MSRLTKLERMSPEDKTAESNSLWAATDSAAFTPETMLVVSPFLNPIDERSSIT
ncbi:hypothetical protein [Acinetobacter tjernbergiae]|uniref:Uncharacterized protein n=1 Tax=Acinetobacter tjernbergiae DSM 14971 = CIP 107465 TaxID=1120928 RepID=V2UY23_9GAMM|nr:hypothetical protein [Acinetobacter tjernbergiae]ESK54897.1 hypothetical protein F990_02340 [Acinetobacter tjernbergiae DSM 14971 = CIP 107465]